MAFDISNYAEVHERVAAFNEKFPEGIIQSELTFRDEKIVIMRALVYRNPTEFDSKSPTIAYSQLGIPGSTPYTKGSEIENCETSAVGRALAFMGFAAKKSIASQDEIRNKQKPAPEKAPSTPKIENKQWMKDFNVYAKEAGSSIREAMKLGEQANLLVEMDNWQKGNGYTDAEALEEAKKLIPAKAEA